MKIDTLIALNLTENNAGRILSKEELSTQRNKFLKKEFNGLTAHAKAGSQILIRDNQFAKLHLLISDKNEINAYVSRLRIIGRPTYLIVIYRGVFSYMHNLFLLLMTSQQILPDLGTRKERSIEIKDISEYFVIKDRLNIESLSSPFLLLGLGKMDSSENDHRNQYALLLTSLAFEFLYFHELTHIDHGHLDFIKNKVTNLNALYSTDNSHQTGMQLDRIKGIEMEADLGAAEFLYDSYWNVEEYRGTLMKKFPLLLKNNETWFFATSYSLLWLFHLVQDCRILLPYNALKNHPSPECRILGISRIFYILAKNKNGNTDLIYNQFKKAIIEYLHTCKLLGVTPHYTEEIFNKNSNAEIELLQTDIYRSQLLPQLRSYHFERTN